jgi:hypothetical protein
MLHLNTCPWETKSTLQARYVLTPGAWVHKLPLATRSLLHKLAPNAALLKGRIRKRHVLRRSLRPKSKRYWHFLMCGIISV